MTKQPGAALTLTLTVAEARIVLAALNGLLDRPTPFRSDARELAEETFVKIRKQLAGAARVEAT